MRVLAAVVVLGSALSCVALDSSDLLFHLSFDGGVEPDFARGSAEVNWGGDPLSVFGSTNGAVARSAVETRPRLVDGLIGKGYRFGGAGSTLEYFFGEHGRRGCDEPYGPRVNMFGDTGSVSLWVKGLTNTHNQMHLYWRADAPGGTVQIGRNQYKSHMYNVRDGGGADLTMKGWTHLAMTWRKGEVRFYCSGYPCGTVATGGLDPATLPERFYLAATGVRSAEFCKQEYEDDTVIDEVQIFRRALTPEEVQALFERGRVSDEFPSGANAQPLALKPERAFVASALAAARPAGPIVIDGRIDDWTGVPAHGGFVDTRLGVLDSSTGRVWVAADGTNLYLAFECEVDKSIQDDPTHVWYPTGAFKADAKARDGDVLADDYVEFVVKGLHEDRFAVNAAGALRDSRDGDVSWNAGVTCVSRYDFSATGAEADAARFWRVELAVPLADLGVKSGDAVGFNVLRMWRLFKSARNTLITDEHAGAGFGALKLGGAAVAAVESLGEPHKGRLNLRGRIVGPAGAYTVKLRGQGLGQAFTNDIAVTSGGGIAPFALDLGLARPGDMAVVVEVLAPDGALILARTIPFVYVATSLVELIKYPGWGKLDVQVTPVDPVYTNLSATVRMLDAGGVAVASRDIAAFANPIQTVRFDTQDLATGRYAVVTVIMRNGGAIGEDRQTFEKKTLPEWYGNQAGIIDGPPVPWTDVRVRGRCRVSGLGWRRETVIECLLKEIVFQNTLFPKAIRSNGQQLLAGPMRLRVKRGGREKTIAAGDFRITETTRRRASWESVAKDGDLTITVRGWTEFDGFTSAGITLAGGEVERLAMEIPWRRECATLKQVNGKGALGDRPIASPWIGWIGNEKAGLQVGWEHDYTWVRNGESPMIVPTNAEVVAVIPFIQKPTTFDRPRTVVVSWAISPTKPVRKDWRMFDRYLYRTWTGLNALGPVAPLTSDDQSRAMKYLYSNYGYIDWCMPTPNYPKTTARGEAGLAQFKKWLDDSYRGGRERNEITSWYAYGPFTWVGSPEYAEWWREWRDSESARVPPDPNSSAWGPACYNSSAAEMFLWMLEKYVKEFPCRGLYFDCMGQSACANEAHGCGYVDENGVRRPLFPGRAMRQFYERVYNIIKTADPEYGWIRHHDWGPSLATAAFCDENWMGEGLIGPIRATPEKNYYRVVDLPMARVDFRAEHYGHLTAWLGELGCSAEWVGVEVEPGVDGKPGKWVLPRWKDYEHEIGISFVNDTFTIGGNESPLPSFRLAILQDQLQWAPDVRFIGYWELDDRLAVGGGVPETIVCSIYCRPPGGKGKPFLLLVPMNNSDADVTLKLRPDLRKLGFRPRPPARFKDAYRAIPIHHLCIPDANNKARTQGYIDVPATDEVFEMENGELTVPVEKRNFRALLLGTVEPSESR
ncbi:MAG: DUF6067 family protein [Kiritimatiellae bacterium]|nr:DUF6067 family protein [Kiritimatiellia bacterium]